MIKIDDILHPFPKGAAAFSMRIIEQDLTARYYTNIKPTISIKCFKDKDDFYVYAKVPSEGNPDSNVKLFYDVVIRFIPPNKEARDADSYRNYNVEVFCNIPSFMFTFTNTLKEKKALLSTIPEKYFAKKAITEKAKTRNPIKLMGIDKSIWFTVRYMEQNKLFNKSTLDSVVDKKLTIKEVVKLISTQEEKLGEAERRNQFRHKEMIDRRRETRNKKEEKENGTKSQHNTDVYNSSSSLKVDMHSGLKSDMKSSTKSNLKANMKSSLSVKKL